jgi:hypothetical protein
MTGTIRKLETQEIRNESKHEDLLQVTDCASQFGEKILKTIFWSRRGVGSGAVVGALTYDIIAWLAFLHLFCKNCYRQLFG